MMPNPFEITQAEIDAWREERNRRHPVPTRAADEYIQWLLTIDRMTDEAPRPIGDLMTVYQYIAFNDREHCAERMAWSLTNSRVIEWKAEQESQNRLPPWVRAWGLFGETIRRDFNRFTSPDAAEPQPEQVPDTLF